MAIIRSLGIGDGKKSAGMLTYRTVRGRTIASQRIVSNTSNTPAQSNARATFRFASKTMLFLLGWIERGFDRSKYGSPRNHFMKLNKMLDDWSFAYPELESGSYNLMEFCLYGFEPQTNEIGGQRFTAPGFKYVTAGEGGGVVVNGGTPFPKADLPEDVTETSLVQGVTFVFPSPVLWSDVEVGFVVIPDKGSVQYQLCVWDGMSSFDVNGLSAEVDIDNGELLTSIDYLAKDIELAPYGCTQAIIVPIVRVRKKTVTGQFAMLTPKPTVP